MLQVGVGVAGEGPRVVTLTLDLYEWSSNLLPANKTNRIMGGVDWSLQNEHRGSLGVNCTAAFFPSFVASPWVAGEGIEVVHFYHGRYPQRGGGAEASGHPPTSPAAIPSSVSPFVRAFLINRATFKFSVRITILCVLRSLAA